MQALKFSIVVLSIFTFLGCSSSSTFSRSKNWLEGQWVGVGHQIDITDDNKWTIELMANLKDKDFKIKYPSLNCSGKWKLITYNKSKAVFREVIEKNTYDCVAEGKVILFNIDSNHVVYSYFYKGDKKASAYSTLEKVKQ